MFEPSHEELVIARKLNEFFIAIRQRINTGEPTASNISAEKILKRTTEEGLQIVLPHALK